MIATSALEELGRFRHRGNVGAAAALAVLSCVCYAMSAVMQQQEACRPGPDGRGLVIQLIRRPRWWLAVSASGLGAVLHIAALAVGPLSVVQPIGVLTLVFALPLGARWRSRAVSAAQWRAAAAVAGGVLAVLLALPHRGAPARQPLLSLPTGAAVVAVVVVVLAAAGARLPSTVAPVVRAAAAATCFGFASGVTRVATVGTAPFWGAALMAVTGAAAGLLLAQSAYRAGGLGGTVATLILVDPLVAVTIGFVVLGEPVPVTAARICLGACGVAVTAVGIWVLARAEATMSPDAA